MEEHDGDIKCSKYMFRNLKGNTKLNWVDIHDIDLQIIYIQWWLSFGPCVASESHELGT